MKILSIYSPNNNIIFLGVVFTRFMVQTQYQFSSLKYISKSVILFYILNMCVCEYQLKFTENKFSSRKNRKKKISK